MRMKTRRALRAFWAAAVKAAAFLFYSACALAAFYVIMAITYGLAGCVPLPSEPKYDEPPAIHRPDPLGGGLCDTAGCPAAVAPEQGKGTTARSGAGMDGA